MKFRADDRLTVGVVAVVIALDQLTKTWALRNFADGPTHVFWTLEMVVAHNTGAAFSLFSGSGVGPLIGALAVVIIAVVVRSMRGIGGKPTAIAVGLVVGGAIGNLIDRAFRSNDGFLHGAVVDWINFGWWPVFNIADACVVVGAIVLAICAFRMPEDEPAATATSGERAVQETNGPPDDVDTDSNVANDGSA